MNYTFRLIKPKAMPDEALIPWLATLELIDRVITDKNIKVKKVRIHYHPNGMRTDHALGEADFDYKTIVLCASDFDTALHEIAHIWMNEYHSKKWARALYRLYDEYVPEKAAEYRKYTSETYMNAKIKPRQRKGGRAWKTSHSHTCSLDGSSQR